MTKFLFGRAPNDFKLSVCLIDVVPSNYNKERAIYHYGTWYFGLLVTWINKTFIKLIYQLIPYGISYLCYGLFFSAVSFSINHPSIVSVKLVLYIIFLLRHSKRVGKVKFIFYIHINTQSVKNIFQSDFINSVSGQYTQWSIIYGHRIDVVPVENISDKQKRDNKSPSRFS